jgi:hypothetical protein
MTEKKRPTKPGQENLDPNLYGPKENPTYTSTASTGESGIPPSPLSRENMSTRVLEYSEEITTSIHVSKKLWLDFKKALFERGLERKTGWVLSNLIARWLDTRILAPRQQDTLLSLDDKRKLRQQVEELDIENIISLIEEHLKMTADTTIEERQKQLALVIGLRERLKYAAKKAYRLNPTLQAKIKAALEIGEEK